jgi:hypothetical protein
MLIIICGLSRAVRTVLERKRITTTHTYFYPKIIFQYKFRKYKYYYHYHYYLIPQCEELFTYVHICIDYM